MEPLTPAQLETAAELDWYRRWLERSGRQLSQAGETMPVVETLGEEGPP